ncbi:hypothetical protein TNCV_3552371 [Trichonephila clavipes]|nr:hypothetical protein TNCV_3552371 [Trichonephila clavipes]
MTLQGVHNALRYPPVPFQQGRSCRRINDTGPPSYRGPIMPQYPLPLGRYPVPPLGNYPINSNFQQIKKKDLVMPFDLTKLIDDITDIHRFIKVAYWSHIRAINDGFANFEPLSSDEDDT